MTLLVIVKNVMGLTFEPSQFNRGENQKIMGLSKSVLGLVRKPPSVLNGILLSALPLSSLNN